MARSILLGISFSSATPPSNCIFYSWSHIYIVIIINVSNLRGRLVFQWVLLLGIFPDVVLKIVLFIHSVSFTSLFQHSHDIEYSPASDFFSMSTNEDITNIWPKHNCCLKHLAYDNSSFQSPYTASHWWAVGQEHMIFIYCYCVISLRMLSEFFNACNRSWMWFILCWD